MKNLQKLAQECLREADAIGIKYGHIVEFKINTRAKRRWGQTTLNYDGYSISISNRLLQDDISDINCKNTIMHEILHTVDGCMNHGRKWKYLASIVNNIYGYNIKTHTSAQEKGFSPEEIVKMNYNKYSFVCKKCGKIITRQRASSFTRNPEQYRHLNCGGEFKEITAI